MKPLENRSLNLKDYVGAKQSTFQIDFPNLWVPLRKSGTSTSSHSAADINHAPLAAAYTRAILPWHRSPLRQDCDEDCGMKVEKKSVSISPTSQAARGQIFPIPRPCLL